MGQMDFNHRNSFHCLIAQGSTRKFQFHQLAVTTSLTHENHLPGRARSVRIHVTMTVRQSIHRVNSTSDTNSGIRNSAYKNISMEELRAQLSVKEELVATVRAKIIDIEVNHNISSSHCAHPTDIKVSDQTKVELERMTNDVRALRAELAVR